MHAQTVDSDERVSVSVISLRSPTPLASSGRPSSTGAPSVAAIVVDTNTVP